MLLNKEGKPFDRTIVSQLISSVEKSPNQMISQEDFIRTWTDMESKLREKVERNEAEIKRCQLKVTENVSSKGTKVEPVQNGRRQN